MRGTLILVVVYAFCLLAGADKIAPHRTVNLDLPPKQRWSAIATEYKEPMTHTLNWVHNKSKLFGPIVSELKAGLKSGGGWPSSWVEEMHGLADAAGVDYDIVESANLFFEWDPGCTAILAQLDNGTIIHGRNFDFSVEGLPQITLQLSFTRNGKVVYKGTSFAGYIGVITAMRPGRFSISVNSRFQGDHGGKVNLFENVKVAKQGGKPVGTYMRWLVDNEDNTYSTILELMKKTLLIDVAYYAVAGVNPGEGAIITRGRFGIDESHGASNGTWALDVPTHWWRLQTNFDHWGPAADGRRAAGNEMMAAVGRDAMSLDAMKRLLDVTPVLAPDTDFTALMNPATGSYTTILRSH